VRAKNLNDFFDRRVLAFNRLKDDFKTERFSWENVLLRGSFEDKIGGTVLLQTYRVYPPTEQVEGPNGEHLIVQMRKEHRRFKVLIS
jgi:hypothetical protein